MMTGKEIVKLIGFIVDAKLDQPSHLLLFLAEKHPEFLSLCVAEVLTKVTIEDILLFAVTRKGKK